MQKKILQLSWIAGLLLFVLLIYKIGLGRILENIQKLTWQHFAILIALRCGFWSMRTFNWLVVYRQYNRQGSFLNLFWARLAGHAISYLTPTSHLGGEAIRALSVNSPDRKKNLASVIVDKTLEVLVMSLFTILGVMIAFLKTPLSQVYKIPFIALTLAAVVFMLFIMYKQKQGFLLWLLGLLQKLKLKFRFMEKNREKIIETDKYIADFYSKHSKVFPVVLILYALMILFWAAEIHLTLKFIGVEGLSYLDSFLIVTLGSLAFILPLFPGSLGTYEATYVAIFALFGLGTDAGISLTLIRRIIALFWAGVGLLTMIGKKDRFKT